MCLSLVWWVLMLLDVHKRVSGTLRFYEGPPTPPQCHEQERRRSGFGLRSDSDSSGDEDFTGIFANLDTPRPVENHIRVLTEQVDETQSATEQRTSETGEIDLACTAERGDTAESESDESDGSIHDDAGAIMDTSASQSIHEEEAAKIFDPVQSVHHASQHGSPAASSECQISSPSSDGFSQAEQQSSRHESIYSMQCSDSTDGEFGNQNTMDLGQPSEVSLQSPEEQLSDDIKITESVYILDPEKDCSSENDSDYGSLLDGQMADYETDLLFNGQFDMTPQLHDHSRLELRSGQKDLIIDLDGGTTCYLDEENTSLHWDDSDSDMPSEYDIQDGSVTITEKRKNTARHDLSYTSNSSSNSDSESDSEAEIYYPGALASVNQVICSGLGDDLDTSSNDENEAGSEYEDDRHCWLEMLGEPEIDFASKEEARPAVIDDTIILHEVNATVIPSSQPEVAAADSGVLAGIILESPDQTLGHSLTFPGDTCMIEEPAAPLIEKTTEEFDDLSAQLDLVYDKLLSCSKIAHRNTMVGGQDVPDSKDSFSEHMFNGSSKCENVVGETQDVDVPVGEQLQRRILEMENLLQGSQGLMSDQGVHDQMKSSNAKDEFDSRLHHISASLETIALRLNTLSQATMAGDDTSTIGVKTSSDPSSSDQAVESSCNDFAAEEVGQSILDVLVRPAEAHSCPVINDVVGTQTISRKRPQSDCALEGVEPPVKRPRRASKRHTWKSTIKNTALGVMVGASVTFLGLVALGST